MADLPPIVRILEAEMRQRFNTAQFNERAQRGELIVVVLPPSDHLAPPSAGQEPGTVSQTISYRDHDGNELARAHRYLKPDGTLGGSGRPDPKRLLQDGVLYRLVKKRNR